MHRGFSVFKTVAVDGCFFWRKCNGLGSAFLGGFFYSRYMNGRLVWYDRKSKRIRLLHLAIRDEFATKKYAGNSYAYSSICSASVCSWDIGTVLVIRKMFVP